MKDTKNNLIASDAVLSKSNSLSFSRLSVKRKGRKDFRQAQFFTLGLLRYNKETQTSTFTIKEFRELFGLSQYKKKHFEIDREKLTELRYKTYDNEYLDDRHDRGESHDYIIIPHTGYKNGVITLYWEFDLSKKLGFLAEGRYMLIDVAVVSKFKDTATWILYEELKTKYNKKNIRYLELSYEECRELMGYKDNTKYPRYQDFRRFVLDRAIKEINEYTEYFVEYTPIKEGKKIVGIKFEWRVGKIEFAPTAEQLNYINDLRKELNSYNAFLENENYVALRNVFETDLETLTFRTANLVIRKCQDVINQLQEDLNDKDMEALLVFQSKLGEAPIVIKKDSNETDEFEVDYYEFPEIGYHGGVGIDG